MKKALYGVALLSSMILTACTDGPEEPKIPGIGEGSTKLVAPVFAPGNGELPIPNDVLFSGTTDLTLNIPTDDPSDMSDPQNAISALDGWSTHAPFSIEFRGAIDGSTIAPGQNVRIFKVSVNRPEAIAGTGIPAPTGPVTGVEAELTAGVDFVAVPASETSIGVVPLRPLEPQASYMVVVTDSILDTNGNAVIPDSQFAVVKSPDPIPEGSATAGLEPLRQLTQAMLAASSSAGIDSDDVVLTYQFTVQSVANALVTANNAYVQVAADQGLRPASSFSPLTDTSAFGLPGAAVLFKGQVTLPYLLTAPTAENQTAVLDNSWVGAEQIPTEQGPVPNPLAGAPITYANPLAQKTGDEIVPLLVSLPKDPGCSKPYPVMIFQHGITSNRTAMLGIADTMAATCTAVVAMDLPLHGIDSNNQIHLGLQQASGGLLGIFEGYDAGGVRERTFGVDYINNETSAPGPDGQPDPSGAHTINLTNLLVSRDNLRQAVLDLLVLEEAIPAMDVDGDTIPDFDADNISFMGHSLGGIAGSKFVGLSDKVKVSVQATTSGSIAQMLDGSASFSPRIRAGLAAASGIPADDPAFESAVLKPFLFAAQTVVDSGDPVNYAGLAQMQATPMLALQVQNDQVVPNAVEGAPLAGSIPHAALFGLPTLTESAATDRAFLKYVSGDHASPLSPNADAAVTVSMQTAIANFIASGGTQVVINDPALVEE